jgi:DNA primase catalytic core
VARVPEAEVARLKREVSVERLARAQGVKLSRRGQDLVGLCPFHDDKEPSLIVTPEKNLWHCLGACDTGGSVIDWVMRSEKVGFREAVEHLQQLAGGRPAQPADPVDRPQSDQVDQVEPRPEASGEPSRVLEPWMDDRELWDRTIGYYRECLGKSEEARGYLEHRGLGASEVLEHFEVGFADRTLAREMPPRRTKPGQRFRKRLQELGIMRPRSGQEHMTGRVTLPTRDESGLVVGVYGRIVQDPHGSGTPKHLYLPGPRRGVFHWQALLAHREVILCEAPLDAMTFWAAGFEHVLSSWGANGFSSEHLAALVRYGTKRVLLAYDRDKAGDQGAAKVAEQLLASHIECFRVLFPRGMDANGYARKVQPAAKSLGLALRQAQWMGKGKPPAASTVVLAGEEHPAEASETAEPEAPEPADHAELPAESPAEPPETLGELQARAEAAEALASSLAARAAPERPAASPAPPAPGADVPVEVRGEEVVLWRGDRRYRVRGLQKNLSYELLKVNLLASRNDAFHVDTFDLYSARLRLGFAKQAAAELDVEEEVVRRDLGRVLLKLEELQQEAIERELHPEPEVPVMSPAEREEALELLSDPRLVERILEDFERSGVVGEEVNKLVGYLAAVSRKLDDPLAVILQSSSAAGKSAVMEAILDLVPEEERVQYSAMTGQSLFYMSEQDLAHKILAVAEEEGAERASYALKLLQSEGELTIASTGKDPQSGRLVTHEYRVEGPVAIFLTTTAIDVDEELLNRCLVLTVNETREQTRAIHRLQRERRTLAGLLAGREREAIVRRHRNAQRLLRPLSVVNPYAPALTFLDTRTRTRRDHAKYLALIDAVALVHQHQRPVKTAERSTPSGRATIEYIEVTLDDVELANRLAGEVLGRSLDELPPQTRRLLGLLDRMVGEISQAQEIERSDVVFTRRQVRAATGWRDTQLRLHLGRLVELEYVLVHQGGRGRSFLYELVYEEAAEAPDRFLPGLIDVAKLREATATGNLAGSGDHLAGQEPDLAGPTRPRRAPNAGGARSEQTTDSPSNDGPLRPKSTSPAGNARLGRPAERSPGDRRAGAPAAYAAGGAVLAQGRGS